MQKSLNLCAVDAVSRTEHRLSWRIVIAILLVVILTCGVYNAARAATIIVNNVNSAGQGFNDSTPAAPVTGNPATTVGAQRLAAFQAAADQWGATLVSNVTIVVDAQMTSLSCTANSGTLGSAGATSSYRDFPGAALSATWYPKALANAMRNADNNSDIADISANFNQDIGSPGCLQSIGWSYVIGAAVPSGTISFFDTVIHEVGHGLGFFTLTNRTTGALPGGRSDSYTRFLMDENASPPTLWPALSSNAARAASATSNGQLTWAGPEVSNIASDLNSGRHASGRVRMYAPSTLAGGSSVSHWDTALSPNDIMEPSLTSSNLKRFSNHLMLDLGWNEMTSVSVSISDGMSSTQAGMPISYTISISNNGPADLTVVNANVTDIMPSALNAVSWTCNGSGGAVCGSASGSGSINTLVSVPLNGVISMTVDATIDPGFTGLLSNTVDLSMPGNIMNTVSSSATDQTSIGSATSGITLSALSGDTSEAGDSATFTVVLDSQPGNSVSIGLSSNNEAEGIVDPLELVFNGGNWNTPKLVTVTGVNDDVDDGNIGYTIITATAISQDDNYAALNAADVPVINQDNDTAGISVSPVSGDTTEAGGQATFTVVLDSEPTGTVTIALSSSDESEGTVSPSSLVFDSGDWDLPKPVTITGVNDDIQDGAADYSVTIAPAESPDNNYLGMTTGNVALTNQDDSDMAGITVSLISGPTNESGATATFSVVLDSEPTGSVTITLSCSDETEGIALQNSVTFDSEDWFTEKQITVAGVDDEEEDGDIAYFIITEPASSSDGNYAGENADNVGVVNRDDEPFKIFSSGFE